MLVLKCVELSTAQNVEMPYCLYKLHRLHGVCGVSQSMTVNIYFSQLLDVGRIFRFANNKKTDDSDADREHEAEQRKKALLSDRPIRVPRKQDTEVAPRYLFDMDSNRRTQMRRRFRVAMQTAYVLLVHRYGGLQDLWKSDDHFYLYQLCMSNSTVSERQSQIETLLAKQLAFQPINGGTPATAEDIHRLVSAAQDDVVVAQIVDSLHDEYNFQRVLSEFQITTNDNQRTADRAADPTDNIDVVNCTVSSYESLVEFAADYCLLDVLDAQRASWSTTGVVARFDASTASPLSVLTSIRTFDPGADAKKDYTLFWTPASNEFYLRTTERLWYRLIMGGLTFASAQLRARSAPGARMLCTPLIYASLASDDGTVVSSGLSATLMLMTAGFRYQNVLRSNTERAKELVRNLDAVLHAFCGTPCDNVELARLLLEPIIATRSDGARIVRPIPDGVYAAAFAALADDAMTMQIDVRKLKSTPMDDSLFCDFLKAQMTVYVDRATFQARRDLATKNQLLAIAAQNVNGVKCACGRPLDSCSTASSLLNGYARDLPTKFSGIMCCVCCERVGYLENPMRPRSTQFSSCSRCLARGAVVLPCKDASMVVLAGPAAAGLFTRHEIVRELAQRNATDLLSSLRLVTDGDTYRPPTPRPLETPGSIFAPPKRKPLGRTVSLELTNAFLADIPPVEPA